MKVLQPTEFETGCADRAIAILNGDVERLNELESEFWAESRDPWEVQSGAQAVPPDDPDLGFEFIEAGDPFAVWLMGSDTEQIEGLQKELRPLVDTWIAAGYTLAKWTEAERFQRFLNKRPISLHNDWYGQPDRRGRYTRLKYGRLTHGFDLPPNASVADYAMWLFYNLVTGFYCMRIGRCGYKKCGKYCLRLRSGRFFCNVTCSRGESATRVRRRGRERDRKEKIRVLVEEANKLNRKTWNTEKEWREKLLVASQRRRPDIKKKFLTMHAGEVPRARLRSRE
jgi:hypothetical protein